MRPAPLNAISLNANIIMMFNFFLYKMTQYNSLNVKLSNSKLNKLKSAMKNETEVVFRLSSNIIGDNKKNFTSKIILN